VPLHKQASGIDRLTGLGFLLSLALWGAGITLPVLHVTELFMYQNDVSLVGIVAGLFNQGEPAIGVLVLVFTLLLPPAKLIIGYGLWRFTEGSGIAARRGIAFLDAIGKWTMLDVLVLAIVVVTLKSSWVAEVEIAPGPTQKTRSADCSDAA
jgi:paraquat-inducible protein A